MQIRPIPLVAVLLLGYFGQLVSGDATSTFQALVKEYWDWRLLDAPEFASSIGVNTYNDKVESFSLQVLDDRKVKVDGYLSRLGQINKDQLSKSDKVSYEVLKDTLQTFVDGYKWRFYGPMNPINFLEGMWTDPKSYAIFGEFKTSKDLEDFIKRLGGWSNMVQEYETRMRVAIDNATTNNWVSEGDRLLTQLDAMDVAPEQFALYEPFNETLDNMSISDQQKATLRQDAKQAIKLFLDAYRGLKTFMNSVYKNDTRTSWGVNSFKDGEAYYKACLKWHLSTDITPEEVHEKGLQEVDRIYKKMIAIMGRLNFHGTISEFFTQLRKDPRFIINDPDTTVERFRQIIFERIKPKLPKYFKNIPDMPVTYTLDEIADMTSDLLQHFSSLFIGNFFHMFGRLEIPGIPTAVFIILVGVRECEFRIEKMPYDGPGGQYMSGSPDGSRPGKFQVNVIRPEDNPTFDMVDLALHEADPGHHLQDIFSQASTGLPDFRKVVDYNKYFSIPYHFPFYTAYTEDIFSQASSGLPDFRKVIDDNKYYSVPYFFPFYTAYLEGWALYAESLGEKEELDIYKDDYELMGRYSAEIFRACRLVVDTGLHHYNWTRERAIEYMLNYTSYTRPAISIEIDRYITWPGQACAYKIGELKIWELRRRAETFLGDLFDIKGFHSVVLDNGAVPLDVLHDLVEEWIHEQVEANTEHFFTSITKDFWKWRQKEEPELATFAGIYKYNDKLESFNYTVYKERLVDAYRFLVKLIDMDRNKLSTKQRISYDVLKNVLTTYTDGYTWIDYGNINPFNFIEGFHIDPSRYLVGTPFDTQGDFVNFARRLELFPQQYDEMFELARLAIQLGTTDNNVSVNRIPVQIDNMLVNDPVHFALYKPFNDSAEEVFAGDTANIEGKFKTAINNILSKMTELKTFITNEYMPNTRQGLGVAHLVNGSDYYQACLQWHTSLNITPAEVHQKGLDEVDRISKLMKLAMGRLGFPGETTIKQAYAAMANDSRFLIQDGDETLERFRQIIFDRIKPKLPQYFKNIPNLPLVVKASASDGISGEYMSGSEDGTVPGTFYANVRRPEDNPTYAMVSLSLHEAIPGHHLAESYSMTSDMPDFRKYYTWRSYSAPFYFPFFNSYVEGWALYAEYLGEEMGVYENDYELMGRYSDEMWRACRLVVDTGIHYFNWTREQSINYMMNYTAITRKTAEIEIDRYATWPGQACGYKIGEMKIKELRKRAENVLGAAFDIRDFHYAVLSNGAVPLDVLEGIIDNWIVSAMTSVLPHQQTCKPITPVPTHTTNVAPVFTSTSVKPVSSNPTGVNPEIVG